MDRFGPEPRKGPCRWIASIQEDQIVGSHRRRMRERQIPLLHTTGLDRRVERDAIEDVKELRHASQRPLMVRACGQIIEMIQGIWILGENHRTGI